MRDPLLALLALALAGCGALNDYQTAATLPVGSTEVGLELSGFSVADHGEVGDGLFASAFVSRHGLTEGFELGLRLGTMGAEVTGKWLLLDDAVRLAIAPTMSGFTLGSALWWAGLRVPLLVEVPLGAHALVFSPRAQGQVVGVDDFIFFGEGTGYVINVGVGVGFALALGSVVLMPELSVAHPFGVRTADPEASESSDARFDGSLPLMLQGGVGLRWRFGS